MIRIATYILTYGCTLTMVFAQPVLTLNDALKLALENNFSIQLAKVDAEVDANNNRPGASGMLPVVTGTAGIDNQVVNTRQKFLNGSENNREGALSSQMNANLEMGWTVFDGFKMFAARSRLAELEKSGELRLRAQIENVFVKVIRIYYGVVLAKAQLGSAQEAVDISTQRLNFVTEKFVAGKSAKTEMLKAQVDLNTDKASLIRAQLQYEQAKSELNLLLARDLLTPLEATDSVYVKSDLNLNELIVSAGQNNTGLQLLKTNKEISLYSLREARSERMPVIQLKSGYNFSRQQSQAGFLQSAQNIGFHYGAGLNMNLFNGFETRRKTKNAELTLKASELIYRDSQARMQHAIQQAWANYAMSVRLIGFEQENLKVSREHFDIATEQYRIGVITTVELRDAQLNYHNNEIRLLNAQFEGRMHETELKRLSGTLLKL